MTLLFLITLLSADADPVFVVNTLFSNLQLILPRTFANGSSIGNLTISPVILSGQVADIHGTSSALKNSRVNLTFPVEVCVYVSGYYILVLP
jgi:hypothetical protein